MFQYPKVLERPIKREINLNGSKMNEIVTRFFGNPETILPLAEGSQTFGEDRLAVNTINWQDFVVIAVGEDGIDEEEARTAGFRILADW